MIGDKIKERREELGLTQGDLEKLTGIGNRMISNFEKNKSKPNDETIMILTKALQCDANYLFGYKPAQVLKSISDKEQPSSTKEAILGDIKGLLSGLSDNELLDLYNYVSFLRWKKDNGVGDTYTKK